MAALSKKLRDTADNGLVFWCLGCDMPHRIQHSAGSGPRWTWDGNVETPTFSPSVLVTWDQWEPPANTPEIAEQIRIGEITQAKVKKVCHSFVRAGRIQYLGDCTHALAGQTIDLPDWPDE
jgi:hypothetical protein